MSSRSKRILDKSLEQLGITPPTFVVNEEGIKHQRRVRKSSVDDDDVSSIAESELKFLNPDYVSSVAKCESWLKHEKNYLKELKTIPSANEPATPVKPVKSFIVDYSPSTSTSTHQSDSNKVHGKENKLSALPVKRPLALGDKTGPGELLRPLVKNASELKAAPSSEKDASEQMVQPAEIEMTGDLIDKTEQELFLKPLDAPELRAVNLSETDASKQLDQPCEVEREDAVSTPPPEMSKPVLKAAVGGKRQSEIFLAPVPAKKKSTEMTLNQHPSAKPAAPKLSPYTQLKMKTMEENAREFKETFGYEIPAFDVVYCMQQSMDKEEDGNHKNEVELEKQNSSASSDSYSPSSSSLSSSDSDLSPLPTKRKATPSATRSKRQPSKARRSLEFGLTNTSSLSQSQTHSAGRGKVISEGSQSTSPEASVTLRTEKMVSNEKPGSLKKAMSAPSKNATSSTSEKSVGRHQGHHLFRSTSTGVNNGVDNEAFQESAGPFSNDIFQGHMANDKPPNEKAQKQGRKEKGDSGKEYETTKASVTPRNEKPMEKLAKKAITAPMKKSIIPATTKNLAQGKISSNTETPSTSEKTVGSHQNQTESTAAGSCSANLLVNLGDSVDNDTESTSGLNDAGNDEAFEETAEPLSDDDLQHHVANDKPPSKKALKQERKQKRDSGQEYVTVKGKTVAKRLPKPVHTCAQFSCQDNISKEAALQLCENFWSLSSHNKQTKYVASLVEPHRPERRRVRDVDSGKTRNVTWHYFLEVDGQKHQVCKSTFLDTLCLSETFVRNIQKKKRTSQGGIIPDDARGNHKPVHVLPAEKEEAVMKHINSFPSYVSHYSRSQTKSLYFPSNLSYKKMYKLYKQADNPYVSYSVYKKLAKKTGKKFKKPSKDTCGKCDKLKIQINVSDGEVKRQAEIELEIHQRKAEEAYATKRRLKEEALNTDNMALLVYDLEQCLPTPMLRCGESYYTRQLNTFNLTVYDTKSKLTYCYMWNEVDGGRSANAIASCLLRHILEYVPEGVERLILFSDACTSQNRNSHISAMYFVALQEHASLKSVEHMFLVSGHTHMEPDNKHSVIERYKKNLEKVNVPQEWYDAVEAAGKQNHNDDFPLGKFKVILMKDNFYDFSALLKGPLVKREKTVQNEKFSWLDTFVFHYSKERLGIVQVKSSHNPAALFEDLSFIRVGGRSATIPKLSTLLKKCYTTPQPISLQKKRDLLKLLPYVDAEHHGFYHALTTTALEDTDPDLPEED
ncbi:RNA replicase polyprotein [Frankliniella fusca]|uniref:RNA replicase polyprotein n=1 Tax=Frankliniella fusca TaxID=407009 RepID=A0AAE1HLY7_9NEOP|nr:RNA replicase polyprotein [Frankliniella fusca]